MKKFLLFASATLLTAGSILAVEPSIYPGLAFHGMSPNGNYVVSFSYGAFTILDLQNDKISAYEDMYDPGNGNYINDLGMIVGSKSGFESACYYKDGTWQDMPDVMDHLWSYANGVTSTGSRIVGNATPEGLTVINPDQLMLVPGYWDLNEDGTYSNFNYLPYPDKDLTGRSPQYVTAVVVSEDGKTIAGQVQDFSGQICQPIIYKQDEKGEWTYTLVLDNLFHPAGFHLPEDPGECPSTDPKDYMSEEMRAAYELACDEWYNDCIDSGDWDYSKYPDANDYLDDAGRAALEEAQKEAEIWQEKADAFYMAFGELQEMVPTFDLNNLFMTTDGSTYVTTDMKSGMDFETWSFYQNYVPYVINISDLENTPYTTYPNDDLQVIVSGVTDNGTIIGQATTDSFLTNAYIMPAGANQFESIYDFMTVKNPEIGEWMKENMTHTYMAIDPDTWDYVQRTDMFTGIPRTNPDMNLLSFAVTNDWYDWDNADAEDAEPYVSTYGYLFSTGFSGVKNFEVQSSITVKALPEATLAFTGDVKYVSIYNLKGECVMTVKTPEATLATGLSHGVYVVKAVAEDGTANLSKVLF